MQSNVVVEEAPRLNPELTPELMLPEEGAHLMESYALTQLEQDVVYSVIIQLKSHTENTSSLPVYGKSGGWSIITCGHCHLEGIRVRLGGGFLWRVGTTSTTMSYMTRMEQHL